MGSAGAARSFTRVVVARTFAARFVGLLARRELSQDEGMLFVPGGSIHTLGMRFAIDVVFLDERMKVLEIASRVPPWTFARAPRTTLYVLEVGAGGAREACLEPGTSLFLEAGSCDCL